MNKKMLVTLLTVLLVSFWVRPAQAQQARPTPTSVPRAGVEAQAQPAEARDGSIRGTIRLDRNGDGRCADEPVLAGIPIRFISDDGQTTLYLQSGENGTYGLVAAGYGTWKVSADPPAPYVVTSAKTINAFVGENQKLVLGVDFCVADIANVRAQAPVVLPQSGAAVAPPLAAAALAGLTLLLSGLALEWRRRR